MTVLPTQQHADELAERLRALVDVEGANVSGALSSRLDVLLPQLTKLWVRYYGGTDRGPRPGRGEAEEFAERAGTLIRAAMNETAVRQGVLDDLWQRAYGMGTDHALDTVPVAPDALPERDEADTPDLGRIVGEALSDALTAVSVESLETHGFTALGVAAGKARRAVHRVDAITAVEVTRAAAEGVLDVAREAGADVVWVAERNGCLHCLAYSGETTSPGTPFPDDLTFGDKPLTPHGPLSCPPLHPRCRCTLEVFDQGDAPVAAALKREARRSVLRGWAHESESGPAKVRAADRMLMTAAGQRMPKSVKAVARRAVDKGGFDDARPLPEITRRQRERAVEEVTEEDPLLSPDIAGMDDETLDRAMQLAIERMDWDRVDLITEELDARDDNGWTKAWAPEWEAFTERTGISTEAVDTVEDQRLAVMAELVRQGVSESSAYAEAYGVSGEQFARDKAIAGLRSSGFKGQGFDQLARQSYRDLVYRLFRQAEDDTNGYLLTPEAEAAGVSAIELFSGPASRAMKWASEELREWWEVNGRVTFEDHKAALLGREAR